MIQVGATLAMVELWFRTRKSSPLGTLTSYNLGSNEKSGLASNCNCVFARGPGKDRMAA